VTIGLATVCGIAVVIVLIISNGIPKSSWNIYRYNIESAVLLLVFSNIVATTLVYAFGEGATIA
jgi:hypothetical protein